MEPEPKPNYTEGKNHTITLPSAVTLDLVWMAPGTFTIDSPSSDGGCGNTCPLYMVTINKGYWLGKMLVTQGQYQAVMETNPSHFTHVGADAPVETVSWDDAMEFCRKLTEQERATGRLPEGYAFTLPTEAQWECACRAGITGAQYSNLDDIAWYSGNSGDSTHPVGQKRPNAFGFYDMIGNVWEWCFDWFDYDFPGGSGNTTDPTGPDSGDYRIFLGISWRNTADGYRAVVCDEPGTRSCDLGFRLALAPSRQASGGQGRVPRI
jgi:formylglycine-generating enzyme required for sulfatase activity